MVSEVDKLRLMNAIVNAFANVPYPGKNIAPCGCGECLELEKAFHDASTGTSWQTLDAAFIEEHFGDLPLFSPEAFNYVLPAYLVHALKHYSDENSNVKEWTIYALTPDKDSESTNAYYIAKLRPFTAEQMEVIYNYLTLIRRDPDAYDFYKDIDKGVPRLKRYFGDKD